ncbi:hypothetical protein YC2023_115299 [Brassica napus]
MHGVCDTNMEVCNTTHVSVESRLEISKAKDDPEINAPSVEQKVDILTRAHLCKMAHVTKALVAVSFNHKTHRNLSEEVRRRLYKNWANSKKRRYESEESIQSNLEKNVNPVGGFVHHGVVKEDYLRIKFEFEPGKETSRRGDFVLPQNSLRGPQPL